MRSETESDARELWRLFVSIVLLSLVVAAFRFEQLAGDPDIYRSRMALLFDSQVPYSDFLFEHLPMAVLPMAVAWLLGGAFDRFIYTMLFAGLMAGCLAVTMKDTDRVGAAVGIPQAGSRWLAISAALFPIVLFRYDPFTVLLTVAALWAFVDGRERIGFWLAIAGTLSKGWTVVLSLTEWWRGRRWHAIGMALVAAATTAILFTLPGFTQARVFSGIHSETLFGGIFTLARVRSGESLGLITDAGATYVSVPLWAALSNAAVGFGVLVIALFRCSGAFSWLKGVRLLAASTVAILIGSPLLSPQFLLWPTPFLALHSSIIVRRMAVGSSALTLVYMLGWNPQFEGDMWWVGVLNLRNLLLVALGVMAAWEVAEPRQQPAQSVV